MWIERPVLVPLDRAPELGELQVELVTVAAQAVADELRDHGEDVLVVERVTVDLVLDDRALQAAQLRVAPGVSRLQVEDIGVLGDLARPFDELVGDPLDLLDHPRRDDAFDPHVTVGVIGVDLFLRQHHGFLR